ncbi:hypothetical protein C8J57DRAFT_1310806 [Mycena rebaudengoi]|nr:hypothetical protein C8J57DRAFT_1310806 [Mycena rebaudengoi]
MLTPKLYTDIFEPCLTTKQSSMLFGTIHQSQPKSHCPALLIRKLGVKDDALAPVGGALKAQTQLAAEALDNLRFLSLSDTRGASLLRVVHWGLAAGIDELGKILRSSTAFPHLRELIVTSKGTNNNFNFVQIPGLEVLGYILEHSMHDYEFYEYRENIAKLAHKLSEAIQVLPFTSPLLHSLQLKLCLEYYEEAYPDKACSDLVATINLLRFSELHSLNLSITCYRERSETCYHYDVPPADLTHFVAAHPMITNLSFGGCGLAPISKTTAESLTKLHSFMGYFEHCSIISADNSTVQRVRLHPLPYAL